MRVIKRTQSSRGKIFVLSGPSGSGKTTLHKRLLLSRRLKGKLVKSVSATTRPRRSGEREGRDYLFLSQKKFISDIKTGRFLEWEKVFGEHYGTPKRHVCRLLSRGKNVLLCIDVKGAKTVSRLYPDAVKIFIAAPSLTELRRRLSARNSDSVISQRFRLRRVRREMREAKKFSHVIVNDNLTKALKKLETIILNHL